MTQLTEARAGRLTEEMRRVAEREGMEPDELRSRVALGTVVIPFNREHRPEPLGIGKGLRTKVNANLGTSAERPDVSVELAKLRGIEEAGAEAVMDLSMGDTELIDVTRRAILAATRRPLGTVPIYQAAVEAIEQRGAIVEMTVEGILDVIERQARDGVDFMTIHAGLTRRAVELLREEGRVTDVVSRGGAFLTGWMLHREAENPLLTAFDDILEIARRYDVTLSLGDGLRPGSIIDASDRAQFTELVELGRLVDRAREAGVQVMVEGPGHVPLDQIEANVRLEKRLCHDAPFYVLGPLVTDVAPGYDHITSAIGGALAAAFGADFLCYVTPAEHLGLPDAQDVWEGVVAARIAAHAADLVKGIPGAREWDRAMSIARKALDWERQTELAIDPVKARRYRREKNPTELVECTMCGRYCAMRVVGAYLGAPAGTC